MLIFLYFHTAVIIMLFLLLIVKLQDLKPSRKTVHKKSLLSKSSSWAQNREFQSKVTGKSVFLTFYLTARQSRQQNIKNKW